MSDIKNEIEEEKQEYYLKIYVCDAEDISNYGKK